MFRYYRSIQIDAAYNQFGRKAPRTLRRTVAGVTGNVLFVFRAHIVSPYYGGSATIAYPVA